MQDPIQNTHFMFDPRCAALRDGSRSGLSLQLCRDNSDQDAVTHLAFAMQDGAPMRPLALDQSKAPDELVLFPADPIINARDGRRFSLNIPAILDHFERNEAILPIDLEHASEVKAPKGEPAPAVGWINGLFERDGALWARVTWTEKGRALLENQEYRYISPAFGAYEDELSGTDIVVHITSAGLTNHPALKLPLLAREQTSNPQTSTTKEPSMDLAKQLREALGLPADASEEVIVQTCSEKAEEAGKAQTHLARAEAAEAQTTDLKQFVPRAQYDQVTTQLASFQKEALAKEEADKEHTIQALWDQAVEAKKVVPATKDWFVKTCRAQGVDHMKTFLEASPVVSPVGASEAAKAKSGDGKTLDDGALQMCRQLGTDPEDFAKTLKQEEAA